MSPLEGAARDSTINFPLLKLSRRAKPYIILFFVFLKFDIFRGDVETWRRGDVETWRRGDVETWRRALRAFVKTNLIFTNMRSE